MEGSTIVGDENVKVFRTTWEQDLDIKKIKSGFILKTTPNLNS